MSVKGKADLADDLQAARAHTESLLSYLDHAAAALNDPASPVATPIAAAVLAFEEGMTELAGGLSLDVNAAAAIGRRAALLATSEYVWSDALGALFSSANVGELLGGVSRQRVNELLGAQRLIGLADRGGRRRFPAFQFHEGKVVEDLVRVYWTLRTAGVSEWTAAGWCTSPDPVLDNLTPVQWIRNQRDPDSLLRVASQDAARLRR